MPRRSRLVALACALALVGTVAAVGTGLIGRPAALEPSGAAAGSSPTATAASSRLASDTPASASPGLASPRPSPSPSEPTTAGPLPLPAVPPSATTEISGRLDAALEYIRKKRGLPGISATIVFADGSTWEGASGFADLGAKREVTPRTAFAVASISKTFTAAAVLALVEDGRLSLDESVVGRLPGVRIDRRITVRMLLDHTSGLHDFFLHPAIDRALLGGPDRAWTARQSLGFVAKPYFRPGRGWHYSNTNYLVLGLLVEDVTGRPLGTVIRDRFLEPLALDTAYTQVLERPRGPIAHGYRYESGARAASPIDLSDGSQVMPFTSVVTAAAGAGSIAASSADIGRWAQALYGGDVIGPEMLALMVDPTRTLRFKPRVPYGLGAQAVTIDGRRAFGHSGRFLGFQSVMRYLPDQDIAIAVLTNQSRRDPGVMARQLLRVVLGRPPVRPPCSTCPIKP
jgi:D-alanyl-D-alanine carboxypeptidase